MFEYDTGSKAMSGLIPRRSSIRPPDEGLFAALLNPTRSMVPSSALSSWNATLPLTVVRAEPRETLAASPAPRPATVPLMVSPSSVAQRSRRTM